ncbi:MAG: dihydrodipicolinate reductase [Anaerolineae bacterium]
MSTSEPSERIRVILLGLGSIGAPIARLLVERKDYEIIGAIDTHPTKAGSDLGRVIGLRQELGIIVSNEAKKVLALPADIVIHATSSSLARVMPELQMIVRTGHNIISTCEELADPWAGNPSLAEELDRLAKRMVVSVVATGVNPGFAMDAWPLSLTAVCELVNRVRVRRVVDASRRRMALQKKIGTGLSPAAFAEAVAHGEVGHVGLPQSASLIARGLGWQLDQIEEKVEPILATRRIVTDHFTVEPRFVTGLNQVVSGYRDQSESIRLELQISVDVPESTDQAWIEGRPNLYSEIKGIHGDVSTAAIVVNTARRMNVLPSGLWTVRDLPLVSAW